MAEKIRYRFAAQRGLTMALPLYQGLHAPERPEASAHIGLWFERYFSAYSVAFDEVDEGARSQWLKTCARQKHGQQFIDRLTSKAIRNSQMASAFGGDARVYHCQGRFVTGIGNAHPLENGFSWHPTLGMPYLAGSAVKGLVRAVLETALDDTEAEKKRLLKLWFGTEAKGDVAEQAGALIFLDALPVAPCDLKAEVLTPHMGKWYEKGEKDPLKPEVMPGDWHSPVPVLWLAASDLKLQFTVLPRAGMEQAVCLSEVWEALEYGLSTLGAGAKTALGFGHFIPDEKTQQQLDSSVKEKQAALQQQVRRAQATPAEISIIDLENHLTALPKGAKPGTADYLKAMEEIDKSITRLLESGTADERQRLHDCIKNGMSTQGLAPSKAKEKEFKKRLSSLLG